RSSARLVNAPAVRASAALDHDLATAWVTPFRTAVGSRLDVGFGASRTLDRLDLALVADGRHSVPTELRLTTSAGETRTVALAVPPDTKVANATVPVTARFAPITTDALTVRITKVRPVLTKEYDCGCDVQTPAAIAELGVPNLAAVVPPAQMPSACRTDLLFVDGKPLSLRLVGTTASAVALQPLAFAPCPDSRGRVPGPRARVSDSLGAGEHEVTTPTGAATGLVVDRLVWSSGRGSGPAQNLTTAGTVTATPTRPGPAVRVVRNGRAAMTADVTGAAQPFWLMLGQSENAGWHATVDGHDLGPSQLVDGYANGWLVTPRQPDLTVELEWVPQRTVQRSIALSVVAVMMCLGIVIVSYGSRRRTRYDVAVSPAPVAIVWPWNDLAGRSGVIATVAAAVAVGVGGAIVVRPVVGLGLAAAVVAALWWRPARIALRLAPAIAIAAAGGYVAFRQARHHLPPIFEWPTFFGRIRTIGWLAVATLAASAVVELVASRRRVE
ncbi:MAG: hypothetical protein ABJC79_15160, partial [Acidimicrobiia bacterium]